MSSRSCSPSSPEPKRQRGNSSHRDGNVSPPQLPDSTHTSQPRPRSPDSSSRHSKSQSQTRKSSDHSSHSKSSRRHHKRSRSRSKSPHRRQHESSSSRRSRSRSKSPGVRQGHFSSTRKPRSRSRSESPPHNRRTHTTRPHSRSPPVHRRHEHTRSHKSRSRSKSPSQSRRDSGSAKQARSRSRSPKRFGNRDYKPHIYSGNKRGGSDKPFRGRREAAQYYRTCATPIAKLPKESNTTTAKPATPSASSSAEDLGLTPEQKLERALQAAQALNPKLSAPGPSVSVLSSMSASVGLNTLASSPVALQKKKLLWNKKSSDTKWEGVSFGEEGDDEAQAKFRRLMGMKKTPSTQASTAASAQAVSSDGTKMKEKHEKLFKDLQQQYETSRFMTHLARGSGLGYGTSGDSTQ